MKRLRLWVWLYKQRLWWFQRRVPGSELPMRLYVGMPGSGKTLLAVTDAIRCMRAGTRVASNMSIQDRYTGLVAEPCGSWLDMLRLTVDALEQDQGLVFVWDELHLSCDARAWASTPAWWLALIAQRRHYGISFIGTTQAVDQIEKRLRTLVDLIVEVKPLSQAALAGAVAVFAAICGGLVAALGSVSLFGVGAMQLYPRWWGLVVLVVGLLAALSVFWRRPPIFFERIIDAASIDKPSTEGEYNASGFMPQWVPWYAFGGYSTRELMLGDDFAAHKDSEVAEEIAALTQRAIDALAPGEPAESFAAYLLRSRASSPRTDVVPAEGVPDAAP